MIDRHLFDEFSHALERLLPDTLAPLKRELVESIGLLVEGLVSRLDLVSRAEFDAQSAVLARSRVLLTELEARIAVLERQLAEPPQS
ncbi:MAG TPA: accessory factor UbiK family protein [Pseudomonadales bacterium]|nr:accessory factor UbiK family protein [Pseudomonadales bacterium]